MAKGKQFTGAVDFHRLGCPHKCPQASFTVLEVERREAAHREADAHLCSCPRPMSIRSGLQLRSTPDYIRGGKKRHVLHLSNSLSFLAPGESEHKVLPLTSGTNTETILLVELKQTSSGEAAGLPVFWGSFQLSVSELFKHRKRCLSTKGQVVLASSPTQSPFIGLCRRLSTAPQPWFCLLLFFDANNSSLQEEQRGSCCVRCQPARKAGAGRGAGCKAGRNTDGTPMGWVTMVPKSLRGSNILVVSVA